MKAAVFYKKHDLRIEDLPIPVPKDNEVLLRVGACGICGTDMHIFNGDEGAAATPPGTVLGHEFAGEIVETGKNVSAFKAGDRVSVDPNKLCGECAFCKSGIGHFCEKMNGIGTTVNGGFAEYCAVPVSQLYRLPDALPFTQAAFSEPVSCCLHGIELCGISAGDTVMVIGGGPIGMLMLQLARLSGAAACVMLEPVESKRRLAERLGADLTVDPLTEDVPAVLEQNGIGRIAAVIECVGRPETMEQAIGYAGKRSTVMLFGLTKPQDTITVKPFEIFKKEITLRASFINPYTQLRAVQLIGSGRLNVKDVIQRTAPLDDLPALLSDPKQFAGGKIVIVP